MQVRDLKPRGKYSSRKFWTMMFWQAVVFGVFIAGELSENALESLTFLILGGYFLSNVASKVAKKD